MRSGARARLRTRPTCTATTTASWPPPPSGSPRARRCHDPVAPRGVPRSAGRVPAAAVTTRMSPAATSVFVAPLRRHPQLCAQFAAHLRTEWPSWYGPGGSGDAESDLLAFANAEGQLPVGVVAFTAEGEAVGLAALKATSIPSHLQLGPWAAGGYVAGLAPPRHRRSPARRAASRSVAPQSSVGLLRYSDGQVAAGTRGLAAHRQRAARRRAPVRVPARPGRPTHIPNHRTRRARVNQPPVRRWPGRQHGASFQPIQHQVRLRRQDEAHRGPRKVNAVQPRRPSLARRDRQRARQRAGGHHRAGGPGAAGPGRPPAQGQGAELPRPLSRYGPHG